ncbi:hypothetical protein B4135_0592 [Caldibacillus debilis]|uniref:Uncharacterized protein n=1 Tax=Caldibacillus debilis TaxID=301148 RepID=A0A150M9Z8_9BACI|nr:hypothetical protein B4135_0592 [Caldibacillus debilis]
MPAARKRKQEIGGGSPGRPAVQAEVLSGEAVGSGSFLRNGSGEGPASSTAVWRRKGGFPLDIILTHNHGIMIGRVEAKRVLGW